MKKLSSDFITAAWDYRALLEKKYPRKAVFRLVATRYALSAVERSVLFRGIHTDVTSSTRRSRITERPGDELHIDGFNVVITVASYLVGHFVYLSTDGLLRDTAEVKPASLSTEFISRAAGLVSAYLEASRLSRAVIYIDKPVDGSDELNGYFEQAAGDGDPLKEDRNRDGPQNGRKRVLQLDVMVVPSADHALKIQDNGTIATADSQIIDKGQGPVFDLARLVLEYHFNASFISLPKILEGGRQAYK